MVLCVDFDGTCVTHAFPEIGEDINAAPLLKTIADNGHKIILFTVRSHSKNKENRDYLEEAVEWFKKNGIKLYGINENPDQIKILSTPKPLSDLYIDDKALGAPLMYDEKKSKLPFIDWLEASYMLYLKGFVTKEQYTSYIYSVWK